ncbi:unnamed protein product, partial [Adineta steineri]
MSFFYRLYIGDILSVKQLRHALQLIVTKHESLHTSLIYDSNNNQLIQRVLTQQNINNGMFTITESSYETDEQLNAIIENEKCNPQLFDLTQGLVFRCHIIHYKQISSNNILCDKDIIIFNFHHAFFDYQSMNIFLRDLNQTYKTGQLTTDNNATLRYIDYAVIEQQMFMTGATMFWLDTLHDCHLDQSLSLPYDRYRLSNEHRTNRTTSISLDFGQDLSHHFLLYASSNNIKHEHLALAIYFIFLFKLTNGEQDLCISMNIDNRYRNELESIIGLFENVIPLRYQLDPHWSFYQLLEHVREMTTNSMKYSYLPLQRILNQHPNVSKPAFLDISFQFLSSMTITDTKLIMIGDSQLSSISSTTNINDFSLLIQHDLNINQLSCTINASFDLFNVETIDKISQRFHSLLKQLFTSVDDEMNKSMYEISLTLPNEQYLMQSMNNTQVSFPSLVICIHHEFVYQVMKHPQKLAVELDEQSLTYAELLHYVQVIGIMAIEMGGGVYCPLSPRDPQHRLHTLVQQTQSRLVFVHWFTKNMFNDDITTFDISSILINNSMFNGVDTDPLSKVIVRPDNIAYIIFTSGSTGIPKAVQVRHRNFSEFMCSLIYDDVVNEKDTILQIARCSFDVHVQDILGTFMIGSSLIMLQPKGIMDFDYLANVMNEKNITSITTVPTIIYNFFTFLQQLNHLHVLECLRSVCSGGEPCSIKLINLISNTVTHTCRLWNMYGPAETTIDCTFHLFSNTVKTENIPIGRPLSNYRNLVLDQFSQSVSINQEGELYVGGVGVFAGYIGRDDLSAKTLVHINNELFYRTGDLVRMDNNGLLHYQGRKDHQIKLHGQRIELGEIERCLLNITSISACVVMKWNDDYLVAYVQSSHIKEEQLRQHCQSHLPPHMVPSIFIILDKLPLNANGKTDRKLLPPPNFSSIHLTNTRELLLPTNDIEVSIHHIWCDIFKQKQILTDTNIFSVGGHSLVIMQLFHRYKIQFHLETNALSITDLFQHPTIIDHAQLIYQTMNMTENINDYHWSSLHIIQAKASFAQERIYLDEQIRFSSNKTTINNIYVIPLLYRISSMNDHISITRLHHAFQSVIIKHNILRTALYLHTNSDITQHCLDTNAIINDKNFSRFSIINLSTEEHEQNETVKKILNQSDLFDLSKGRVIRCHILRRGQPNDLFTENSDLLAIDDLILFTIHHAMFDGASTSIFIRDLSLAYQSADSLSMDENTLNYIEYSVHEHIMDMSLSREFWHYQLKGYNIECSLSLPVDRQHSSTNQQRSGLASIGEITFDNELCTSFLNYASSHHLTLFQLGLSMFYIFLFKLTHSQSDLCIGSVNANRYRNELVNMIGMFVSTLPYRLEMDPYWSFDEVVRYVQEKCLSILEHSHYPLQHILGDNRLNQSSVSFLEIMFDCITMSRDMGHLSLNDANLEQVSLERSVEMSKFDFALTFEYNPLSDNKRLLCRFVCSRDLFEKSAVSIIAQRFQYMFEQLFQTQSKNIPAVTVSSSICKLSLILPEEAEEMELVVFHRLENIVNEAPASFAQARIWLDERIRFDPEKPQTAIYNMPFVYRLQPGHTFSIKQLRHALHLIINKHPSLHTSLHFDIQKNLLMQRVITHEDKNNNKLCAIIETTYETDEQLNEILHDEKRNPHLFDLAQGFVFRCHLIYYKQISSNQLLSDKDLLIFNFHHALFDFPSMKVFYHDINQAYITGQLLYDDNTNLRYLDYAVVEQQISMTGASMFWLDALHNCKLDQPLSLPYDRYRLSSEHRTGRGTSISFDFGQDLSHDFLIHASTNDISLEQLALATYYAFLFKLTNGETDLCIGMNTHGRYRDELRSIIGMFVNAIPLRCQLDPHLSFHELTKHVRDIMINCIKYSYFPLQRILNQHPNISNPVFLDTSFEFLSSTRKDEDSEIIIGDSRFYLLPDSVKISEDEIMSKFDFILSFQHDLDLNEFSCTINASLDLFNIETVSSIAQRLQTILHQQFISFDCATNKPFYELSITLSNERYLMKSMNNTQVSFPSPLNCIHHEFVYQVMKHPQKLAVELDEQSLTYSELLHFVQVLSLTLLNEYQITPGEIICQCVERSLSMVIGIMTIEMIGGVYCPLSPRDPQHRLYALVQQTSCRLVLIHHLTKVKLNDDIFTFDIDSMLNDNVIYNCVDIDQLSNVFVACTNIAYIIFTSGSTGIPKAVSIRHHNLLLSINAIIDVNVFTYNDTIVQMASCSFDVHIQELIGGLLAGASILMLHPDGNMDFDYMMKLLQEKQITYLQSVPAYVNNMLEFVSKCNYSNLTTLRTLDIGGDASTVQLINKLYDCLSDKILVWNSYGPAETTINSTYHVVDRNIDVSSIPMGNALANYRCSVLDDLLQSVAVGQEGELFIGGAGVFAGYLGRDDLTAKAFINIDSKIFYRTGDVVKMDRNGLLHYISRKDFQVKLHGQRIELGEIERCLLNTFISACIVMKWNDDYLVAYVQSSHINEEQLRQHCQSNLPSHMIPSLFIILEKLPLNQNGKIDRKQLPSPDFSLSALLSFDISDTPLNQFEERIHTIWCQVLRCNENHISRTTSFFSIGGHSLLFIELYHHYQIVFNFDAHTLSIAPFLQQPTIFQHSQLLQIIIMNNIKTTQWYTLHINEGIASFAQERIFLDEQVRFSSDIAIYNELFTLQIVQGSLSFSRLLQAFRYVLNKHKVLRTSLIFNTNDGILKQCITDIHKTFRITMNQTFENENELRDIIYQTTINPSLFDLSIGRVFHAEIVKHQTSFNENGNENNSNEFITKSDVLLIATHHAAFDRASSLIFFNDLCLAYNTNTISIEDDEFLQYIDYSIHERLIDMTTSREFWYLQFEEYNLESRLSLPVDRNRLSSNHRSNSASTTQISFDNEISQSFLDYASIQHVTPFQLGLTILYVFLFKLTHSENDLCISCLNANRYKTELQNMMGMFVSTLPYRIQLDPRWSFDELVEYVREKCLSILEHSHYPLQHILASLHINQSNISFLETMFDFITISSQSNELSLDRTSLKQVSFEQSFEVAKFDFTLIFVYNPILENNRLSFRLTCSYDLFDKITVTNIGRRLEYCLQQIFSSNETINQIDTCFTSISKINLILPEETQEMENFIFCRQLHIINEAPASFAQIRLWHNESNHLTPYTSQVPIYNMPFFYSLHLHHTLSVQHLRHALQLTVTKHQSLHTSLLFNTEKNLVMQRIIDMIDNSTQIFTFIESTYETQDQLNRILYDEKHNPHLFDLAQGLVFRCHLIYYKPISSNQLLSDKDLIIFNFHHALFDFPSMEVFLHDLNQAYITSQLLYDDSTNLRYLDYSVTEQQMSMTGASMFWFDALHNCKLDQPLSLPYDRYRLSNEHRTGRGTSISFGFGQDLSHDFLIHASTNDISLQYLTFAIYFIFLFKLTNGQTDLCLAMNINNNRYRNELESIIGLFENVVPLRCQLDPHWSFYQLLEHVREVTTKSIRYSYFPLQRILDHRPHISKHAFLDTSLEFISYISNNSIMIGDSQLVPATSPFSIDEDEILSVSDFSLSFHHDMNMNQLSCTINASLDLFNRETVEKVSQRFHFILNQLSASTIDSQINQPIYELSLILSNEQYLMQSLNNTQMSFSSPVTCIHHAFVYQVMKHPQKLAVELDEQSLTYCELLYYVQVLSLHLINKYIVIPGEIICQCVERSLSMVVGILSIAMVGSAYCPLSLRDPPQRLQALVNQTQSRLVLVHGSTPAVLSPDNLTLNIDSVIRFEERSSAINLNELSNIAVTLESFVFVIFTSGSTGIPKAVQLRHRNFTQFMHSFVNIDVLTKSDTIIQMARCSFDNHLLSLVGTLIVGATLVMLRSEGNMDLEYLARVLDQKQITVMHAVPSLLNSLFEFLRISKRKSAVKWLRSLCSGGEAVNVTQVSLFQSLVGKQCRIRNHYGPAEITINCACYLINLSKIQTSISIGHLLPNYQCQILDEFAQFVSIGQEGELLVSGVGVFAGYFDREDLTVQAMININEEMYYKTGDLVRLDNNGLLHYQGRKDHQIKLHGQRIELGEIERCLLNITSISACVVMKWNDDYLVAYVQSSDSKEQELRDHCQSHLPPHMIPSVFIILDKLPLNPNGKIDRKLLPPSHFTSKYLTNSLEILLPTNHIEVSIHHIWCQILKQNQISIDTNIFTIGGHSLLMMQLFHRYKIEFHLETNILSISNLFQHPTIIHHAQLIQQSINTIHNLYDFPWSSLHLIQARASFAQERIYLDEQIRFSSNKTTIKNMYVIPLIYRISSMNNHVSITRLHRAFQSVITKHNILRTALYIDDINGHIIQHCLDVNIILNDDVKFNGSKNVNLYTDDRHHMNEIIQEILNQSDLFDLSKGRVINCHILRHCHCSEDIISNENDDLLTENDHILISIHHAMFDGASTSIFIRDLSLAYQSDDLFSIDDNSLQYMDYSIHEHIMDMTLSQEFWQLELKEYNLTRQLLLPVDRQRSSTNKRSGLASSAQITFDDEMCTSFLNYASSHHLTLFQLGLSIFYVFLFKLTHGETDLCISSINANRYRSELVDMIGMFVSTLPYRAELDPHWSFDEVVRYVQEKCLSILEHSHYPLQHILNDLHVTQSNVSFLETMFDFITISSEDNNLYLNGVNLEQVSLNQSYEMTKFDFALRFIWKSSPDDNQLSCSFVCSNDLFDETTLTIVGHRFQHILEQLFSSKSDKNSIDLYCTSIVKIDLLLPEEVGERQAIMFHRLKNIINEAPASFAQCRIWHENQRHVNSDQSSFTTHNIPFFYRLHSEDILSVKQLRHALQLILNKHESLHTSLIYDPDKNILMQRLLTQQHINNETFIIIKSTYETDEQLNSITENEKCNSQLFDLTQGLVFRCHLVYYKQISSNNILSDKDIIIFNFHHAIFDLSSMNIFLHDLDQAYKTHQLTTDNNTTLRYIDYAVIEQKMSMTGASMFWLDALHDCHLDQS